MMMKSSLRKALAATAVLAVLVGTPVCGRVFAARAPGNAALDRFERTWASLQTYTCTLTVHEANGSRVQDRVMHLAFAKPHDTRVDIVAGDGRGSAIVWRGGSKVRGHQGGLFSGIKADLDLRDHRVTTIRGETIAEANWGSVYAHIVSLKGASVDALTDGNTTTVTVLVANPADNGNVSKEILTLNGDSLPMQYDQYAGDTQVKHVTDSDVRLNVDLPASTWTI